MIDPQGSTDLVYRDMVFSQQHMRHGNRRDLLSLEHLLLGVGQLVVVQQQGDRVGEGTDISRLFCSV